MVGNYAHSALSEKKHVHLCPTCKFIMTTHLSAMQVDWYRHGATIIGRFGDEKTKYYAIPEKLLTSMPMNRHNLTFMLVASNAAINSAPKPVLANPYDNWMLGGSPECWD